MYSPAPVRLLVTQLSEAQRRKANGRRAAPGWHPSSVAAQWRGLEVSSLEVVGSVGDHPGALASADSSAGIHTRCVSVSPRDETSGPLPDRRTSHRSGSSDIDAEGHAGVGPASRHGGGGVGPRTGISCGRGGIRQQLHADEFVGWPG